MPASPPEGPAPPDVPPSDSPLPRVPPTGAPPSGIAGAGIAPAGIGPADVRARAALLRRRAAAGGLDLPVEGASMGTTIRAGASVHVVAAPRPRRGEVWAALDPGGRLVVHRVRHLGADVVVLRGDANPVDDPPLPLHLLVGRVVAATGPGRRRRRFGVLARWRGAAVLSLRGAARRALDGILATRRGRGYSA
ncbi:MAG: S24 family peptidase [Actinomyces sp.]|nr:MAG: S24 family peptidase [Actinomyces sp.]